MIEYKAGDIFAEDVEALVNSVNCVGVMGRGIALQFKNMFPENFRSYAAACKRDEVKPGRMFVYESGQMTNPRYIINFPTKRHWRGKSRIEDIEAGLEDLVREIEERNIRSIAIPPLGTSLGGLNWTDVHPRIESALRVLDDVVVMLFEPGSGPVDDRPNRSTNVPKMTRGRATLVGLMYRYRCALLDPFVTLLEVHKLMYFMELAGEPLRLEFQKGPYGPYAENLRHVLRGVEGHLISGYKDGGDAPDRQLELVPGAIEDATVFLNGRPGTKERLDRVAHLVEGFESSFGLELLATVHWVAAEHPSSTDDEITAHTYAWGYRKKQFSKRQIYLALQTLRDKHWLDADPSTDSVMIDNESASTLGEDVLSDMLDDLKGTIKEAREEGFPIPSQVAHSNAQRLLNEMYQILPRRFEVYPTPDGEVAIDVPTGRGSSVLLLCDSEGGVLCLANLQSAHRRRRYTSTSNLPDDFLREALMELERDSG